jgi:hypothetical protein
MKRGRRIGLLGAVFVFALIGLPVSGASAKAVLACPDFTILHNDRIDNVSLPHGRYEVKAKRIPCPRTTQLLQKWLQKGQTTGKWSSEPPGVFSKGRKWFRIDPKGTGGGGDGGGGRTVCPGTFSVLHNDRIGQLRVPAGEYRITARRMSCSDASSQFARFLDFPSGNLPKPWQLRPLKAKFRNPRTGESFRVKRVS